MKFKKNIFIAVTAAVLVTGGVIGANSLTTSNDDKTVEAHVNISELPIQPMRGSFVIDVNNKKETVGLSDYVFVGKVVSNKGTIYKDIVTMEDENGKPKDVGSPYTNYTIEVIDNIKGKLRKNSPFEILKQGGVTQDNKAIYVFENDTLPEEGKYYIFLGYAQKDGSILISGPNSNTLLNASDKQDIVSSAVYKAYKDAFQNQITKVQRERYTSKFEEK
jgi:hypothetical protein